MTGTLRKLLSTILLLAVLQASPAHAARRPSDSMELIYLPGAVGNTIHLKPEGNQEFFATTVNGIDCTALRFKDTPKNWSWHLDIDDAKWFDKFAEGTLVVDVLSDSGMFEAAEFDTKLHSFLGLNDPVLETVKNSEHFLESVWLTEAPIGKSIIRRLYKFRKARFANGSFNGADIRLRPRVSGFIGLVRVSLVLNPVSLAVPGKPVSFNQLLDHFYSRWLNRYPARVEREILTEKVTKGIFSLRDIQKKILLSWEFLKPHFYPLERTDAIRNLFRITCGRRPGNLELNSNHFPPWGFSLFEEMNLFVDRYYGEILEHAVNEINKGTP